MTKHDDPHANDNPTQANRPNRRGHSGMQAFRPWLRETKPLRDAQAAASERDRAERRTIKAASVGGTLDRLYELSGHSPECIARIKQGRGLECRCDVKPMDDPAIALGLALHLERQMRAGKIAAVPRPVIRLLEAGAANGSAACRLQLKRIERFGIRRADTRLGRPNGSGTDTPDGGTDA